MDSFQGEIVDTQPKQQEREAAPIPDALPLLPLSGLVLFPDIVAPLMVGREDYVRLVEEAVLGEKLIGVVAQRTQEQEPSPESLFSVGTAARILKMMKLPTGGLSFIAQGIARIRIVSFETTDPYMVARVVQLKEEPAEGSDVEALMSTLRRMFQRLSELYPNFPGQLLVTALNIQHPGRLADFIGANIPAEIDEQQSFLEELNSRERLRKVSVVLNREIQKQEMSKKIQEEIANELNEEQRKHLLREQLKKIQKELGEKDEKEVEIEDLRAKIAEAKMPQEAEKVALKEVDRLSMMNPAAPEYSVSRTYLDWLIELPWSVSTEDTLDIDKAQEVLDEDHYDLEKVKKRIV